MPGPPPEWQAGGDVSDGGDVWDACIAAAYRMAGDGAMVLSLASLAHVEDCNLLAGHVLLLLGRDPDRAQVWQAWRRRHMPAVADQTADRDGQPPDRCSAARRAPSLVAQRSVPHVCVLQELFLRSSQPLAALHMRQDLKHWPQALALAHQLDPSLVPHLSKAHAAALEAVSRTAFTHFQRFWERRGAGTCHRPAAPRAAWVRG